MLNNTIFARLSAIQKRIATKFSMNHFPDLNERRIAYAKLGAALSDIVAIYGYPEKYPDSGFEHFFEAAENASRANAWFTSENILKSIKTWSETLEASLLDKWFGMYSLPHKTDPPKQVAVIMAGNIPLVGMHDFLSVLMAGHGFFGKLSSNDPYLLPAIAEILVLFEPKFSNLIRFTDGKLDKFDAVIATGSDNSSRYFEYYFASHPHLIRKNRNGVAVLSGDESPQQLEQLGNDICSYFGLGCRNVSKIFAPAGFDITAVYKGIEPYRQLLANHNKYLNNYQYHRSIYLLNVVRHFDNGFMILTESASYSSPIAVLHYAFYDDLKTLQSMLHEDSEKLQCIVTELFTNNLTVPFGKTQEPALWDYADGVDTLQFLMGL